MGVESENLWVHKQLGTGGKFLPAALSNDDSGIQRAGSEMPRARNGFGALEIRSQSRGPFSFFHHHFNSPGWRERETAHFSNFAPGASRSVNDADVCGRGALEDGLELRRRQEVHARRGR